MQSNHGAGEGDWRKLRLVAGEVYSLTGNVASGARSLCAAVRRGIYLPRKPAGELVPGLFDGTQRLGGGARGAAGTLVAHQVSGGGNERVSRCGYHAAGNDAGRYGCGSKSGRRTVRAAGWEKSAFATDE